MTMNFWLNKTQWIFHDSFLNYSKRSIIFWNGDNKLLQAQFHDHRRNDQKTSAKKHLNLSFSSLLICSISSAKPGRENSDFSEKREVPSRRSRLGVQPKNHLRSPGADFQTPLHLHEKHGLKNSCFHFQCRQLFSHAKMCAAVSPPLTGPIPIGTNLAGEAEDDIGALSQGFDRRRTLRRRLSTVFDSPPENDLKGLEKLITQSQHRDSIDEESDILGSAEEKPPQLKVQDVLTQLDKVISYNGRNISHIIVEKAVKELCTAYDFLEETEKLTFLNTLALKGSVDHESVKKLASSLASCTDENTLLNLQEKLRVALVPKYQWVFSQIGRLEGGVKFLVDMRTDLSEISHKYSDTSLHLKTMNKSMQDRIEVWFGIGFLNLERVTWNSPCDMLQKISEYEAVHPMRNWTDLKRRVGNYRRCYVFTHGSMPGEPIVVLHTALTDHIPSSIGYIVTNARNRMLSVDSNSDLLGSGVSEDSKSITTAVFYSITSTQKGLAGIELGNYLIKRVVKELRKEFPKMGVFSSLSPIPGFRTWFLGELKEGQKGSSGGTPLIHKPELKKLASILECDLDEKEIMSRIHCLISQNGWIEDEGLMGALENIFMRHCARYLVNVKRRGYAMNSVANFHLKNGAVVWRLNWKANMKPRGVSESCGIMVNYRYFLDDCEKNSQDYMENQIIKSSDQIKHLLRNVSSEASSPVSPPPFKYD